MISKLYDIKTKHTQKEILEISAERSSFGSDEQSGISAMGKDEQRRQVEIRKDDEEGTNQWNSTTIKKE